MAKKKKEKAVEHVAIKNKKGDDLMLKAGDLIFCLSNYTVDKATVESVNKETKVATLSNMVQLSAIVYNNNTLIRLETKSNTNATYKLWSDEVEEEYNYWLAKKGMKVMVNCISSSVDNLSKADTVSVYKKLKKIIDKYELVIN